jgi:hypothetical protein
MAVLQGFVFIPRLRTVGKKIFCCISTGDGTLSAVFRPSQSRVQESFELRDTDYIFIMVNNYVYHWL